MSEPRPPRPASPLVRLLADQQQRWNRGDCVSVETLLREQPALISDPDSLLDLIYHEVVLRERKGESPRRDEYLRRFPALAAALNAQFDVHQAILESETESDKPEIPGYELLDEIGRGGMGRVYKARDATHGDLVAVKVLRADRCRKTVVRKRVVAEARAAASLDHPHIVKVFQVGECPAGPYFVMELIEGSSLEQLLRDGPPDMVRVVAWLHALAEAVHYAHGQGIIHRDLKPANILIDATEQPRILDFGMAKIQRAAGIAGLSSTQFGTILGTPSYMPPEQAGDNQARAGPYSDVYSLGAILYALLTGRPPFDEGDFLGTVLKVRSPEPPLLVRSLRPEVPEELERLCQKCLNKRPADRFASARELAEALRPFTGTATLSVAATGEMIPLIQESTVIGRSAECDFVLPAANVSRRHCRLVRLPGQLLVEDLGSKQGTSVNGAKVIRCELRDGNRVEIAGHVFQVQLRPAGSI